MDNKICDICHSPVIEENGIFVCVNCRAICTDHKPQKTNVFDSFYKNISFEKFRELSEFLSNTVTIQYGRTNERYRSSTYELFVYSTNYIVAALSNGKYFGKFSPQAVEYSIYRGQCASENWFGVEKIYSDKNFTVGITAEGQLQPTLCEVDSYLQKTVADLKIKQIVTVWDGGFLGLDLQGKVVVFSPYQVFGLDPNKKEENEICISFINAIKSWPPIKKLVLISEWAPFTLVGITTEGKVVYISNDKDSSFCLHDSLTDVEDITTSYFLKTDGTVTWYGNERFFSRERREQCEKLSNVIQVRNSGLGNVPDARPRNSEDLFLLSNGDLISNSPDKIIAKNVVSIIKNGYICADGSVYQKQKHPYEQYSKIENLKLFESIETVEQEWDKTREYIKNIPSMKNEIKLEIKELEEKISSLENQISKLGLFQGKEKKKLREEIAENKEKIFNNKELINGLPTGRATWEEIKETTSGSATYSLGELNAMVDKRISSIGQKDKSVIGHAVAGGIVAGPTGAIIGAIYALDKNNRKQK